MQKVFPQIQYQKTDRKFLLNKGIRNFLTRVNFEFARHSDIATRHKAQL